jgi:hypothetical protein
VFYINGIKYVNDYDLEEYRPQVQAFLTRRRTTKREIGNPYTLLTLLAPKLWILDNLGHDYRDVYYQQRLVPLELLYEERHLERLYEADDVNSQYVQSVVCEEFEKQINEAIL